MSSSSDRSNPSEEEEEEEGGGGDPTAVIGRVGEPSSSRMRSSNGVWPGPFVEALATQVAVDTAADNGRLAVGPALAAVFQVCSTWRAVSRSELLWQNLARGIWSRDRCTRATWRDEYVYRHRTAQNFRDRSVVHNQLVFHPSQSDTNDTLSCRCLALSDSHLACGFLDGAVRLFDLRTARHVGTLRPLDRDRVGPFSPAVSGIVLQGPRVVFASRDGDVHVGNVRDLPAGPRRAHYGDLYNDGALVNFAGCSRWWVGLYAGVPGRAFHVWDSATEEIVFVGGTLTDSNAVPGWYLLTDRTLSVGRVRISVQDTGVACTDLKVMVFDLRHHGLVLGEEDRRVIVDSIDVSNDLFLVIDNRGVARVRRVRTFEEVCRFAVRRGGAQQRLLACMNSGYAFVCVGGTVRAWDIERGQLLYALRERIGEAFDLVADDEHVAGCSDDAGIHLWRFSAA